ncbi:MAG: HAD-IA family hydrolase [Muribaculaceae bacterium]|nr:HAD-IA family hydrolase [Muribaculaceae bacterium]
METELDYIGSVVAFDLDDTLYSELEFVKSGFRTVADMAHPLVASREAHPYADAVTLYEEMWQVYKSGRNAFDFLSTYVNDDKELFISRCVELYRKHIPSISLYEGVEDFLQHLADLGVRMAIITDGRSVTQRNKLAALGIEKFFAPNNIFISDEVGNDKLSIESWQALVRRYPNSCRFVYVGDNPAKDFRIPNILGWTTIGLRDRGENIHSQSAAATKLDVPQFWVDNFSELLRLLSKQ